MTTTPLLSIRDLHVGFRQNGDETDAVHGIDLDILPGETLGLVGESGSGKSVSALSVLKLLPYPASFHSRGKVLFDGEDLMQAQDERLRQVRGNDIAMIFQEPMTSLNPLHTIEKQIGEILTLHQGLSATAARARTLELLMRVGIPYPEKRLTALPHELSGGQRQRVMIAMALANRPRLLIADEPTTALDVTVQKQILDLLKELQAETGMALLLITHDLGVVRHMADRVCVMQHGEIVETAATETLFTKPRADYTRALIDAEPRGTVGASNPSRPIEVEVRDLKVWFPVKKGVLRKTVDNIRAVDGVDFDIRRGETLGLVGESGSGKTTLGRALLALQKSEGRIKIGGADIYRLSKPELRARRQKMQIVFQDPFGALSPRMSVAEIIGEGLGIHRPEMSGDQRAERVRDVLEKVELDPSAADRYPHEFSGGQRQRIAIARALILDPALIVLDEPTSALDRSVQAQIVELLKRLQVDQGLTYLFISHDLKVVRALAHEVLVMRHGRAVELGSAEDIFEHPQEDYTRQLIAAAFD